ncbi:dephospho-CoA kinase [Agaribacterium sp. ZY112]|uniref:dephospho-CoA kinase n=1 Tax=Agaribacterium sp. ZY112 TaxID=3233574 RepID=UPI003523987E
MLKVGLTGGIGSGKSSVSNELERLGITVVDADIVAREVVEIGQPALTSISQRFGTDILLEDGNLDRAKLRSLIFSDSKHKLWLENLLHPLIRKEIEKQLEQAHSDYSVLSSPLLLETQQSNMIDTIVVVDVDEATQLQRTCLRDQNSRQQIEAIMATQLSRKSRLEHAQHVINNQGPIEETLKQVQALHQQLLKQTCI